MVKLQLFSHISKDKNENSDNEMELIINTDTGKVFASVCMLGKICNVDSTRIRRYRGGNKLVQVQRVKCSLGLIQEMKLYPEELIYECIVHFRPHILTNFAKAGLRVYLHELVGFTFTPNAIATKENKKNKDFKLPTTRIEALEQLLKTLKDVEQLKKKIDLDSPRVEYAEAVSFSDDCISIFEYAKTISYGSKRLLSALKNLNILMKNLLPYQRYISEGYFKVDNLVKNKGLTLQKLITPKGQIWIYSKLENNGYLNKGSR